jgi:hypothetical protein
MPIVISSARAELYKHQIITKKGPDGSDIVQAKVLASVILEPGVQKQVDPWVLENAHFKLLEADGKASAIA